MIICDDIRSWYVVMCEHWWLCVYIYIYIYIYSIAARIPPGQNWVWWVLSTRDIFRCSLQRRFLTKCSCSVAISASARIRIEALLRSLGWPWALGGVMGSHWEIPWRPWRSFGSILEVSEGSGVNPVNVEMIITRFYLLFLLITHVFQSFHNNALP